MRLLLKSVGSNLPAGILIAVVSAIAAHPGFAHAQTLTGALIGTVQDVQGRVLPGARVQVSSPVVIGGSESLLSDQRGQLRFPALPPGSYVLEVELSGFVRYREVDLRIGPGATLERTVVLSVLGPAESIVVEGAGTRIDPRDPGFSTRFSPELITGIPVRRVGMFDFIRATPGLSPTSPSAATSSTGTTTAVSAFGSATNENLFLIDGTNFTCPCNGIARAEPGLDFIQEIQIQSVGASAEFSQMQGAVINVILKQGGERLRFDTAYYGQTSGLTSQPLVRPVDGSTVASGYERKLYRDATVSLGGPLRRQQAWFFAGYQHLRDEDSQPGTDPQWPRRAAQDKGYGKLTWRPARGWLWMHSVHGEAWSNPDAPTAVTPFDVTLRRTTVVPAVTFGHLTRVHSSHTVWDARVGRFVFNQDIAPSTGDRSTTNRFDSVTGVSSGGPPNFTELRIARTTAKATVTHHAGKWFGAEHELKAGMQIERGGHDATNIIPSGVRYIDSNGQPSQSVSSNPSHVGAASVTTSAFVADALTLGNRLTLNAGIRFDHTRAISQDLSAVDLEGRETGQIVTGLGKLYTWNVWSPRLGATAKLTADGRTILRASYGRFAQGVLTGELEFFHPGQAAVTTMGYEQATGAYTRVISVLSNTVNLLFDPGMKPPRSDEYSVGVDREIGRTLSVAAAYVGKRGRDFIGWSETGGQYREEKRSLPDGTSVPVLALTNGGAARRFLLTNPEEYSLTYHGVVVAMEKRMARGWHASGSYTFSKASGLLASSGTSAAGAQLSTVSPPQPLTFGRDPNDLANARGRLANDRPHVFRGLGRVDLPRGIRVAVNLQHFSGKPWAATAQVQLPQNNQQRLLLEPRGTRRLSSQSLLDLRVSKTVGTGSLSRVEILLDVLNLLNDAAEEGIASDNRFSPNFGRPTVFMDPRRAMLGVRLQLGR